MVSQNPHVRHSHLTFLIVEGRFERTNQCLINYINTSPFNLTSTEKNRLAVTKTKTKNRKRENLDGKIESIQKEENPSLMNA